MNTPLVSVVTIFFNEEKYIREAIESVFAQTYSNWELLLVDDGSSDESTEIARQVAEQHPDKVRYLEHEHHQNRGLSASRNLGIRNSKGEHIAFLDADDVWFPNKLDSQVKILNSQPEAAMLYGQTEYWRSWSGKEDQPDAVHNFDFQIDRLIEPPTLLPLCIQDENRFPCMGSVLVRREAIELLGGFEESFLGISDDVSFHSKIFLNKPVFVSSQCWDRYRQHPESSCAVAQRTGRIHDARQQYYNWLAAYLSECGIDDPAIWKPLKRQLGPSRYPKFYITLRRTKKLMTPLARMVLPITVRNWLRTRLPSHIVRYLN